MRSGGAVVAALLAGASGSKDRQRAPGAFGDDVKLRPAPMPNRTNLLYTEMAKTGSGSLRMILPFVQPDCNMSGVGHFSPRNHVNRSCYMTTGPDSWPAATADRRTHFVIGSVREPCDWYISSLAYHWGRVWPNASKSSAAYLRYVGLADGDANNFSASMRDQIRESKPMKDDIDGHHYFDSFLRSYSLAPSVDCWVHTGDFGGSLRACLQLFEAQGGRVDWHSSHALKEALAAAGDAEHARAPDTAHQHSSSPHTHGRRLRKNAPGQQLVHHQPCSYYFPDDLKRKMEAAYAPFYRAFRWRGCCEGSSEMLVGWRSDDGGRPRVIRHWKRARA